MSKRLAVGLLVVVGCADPVRPEAADAQVSLRTAMKLNDAKPIGVAIASNGERFVFDEDLGLVRIAGDQATWVMSLDQLPKPDKPLRPPITDIVALAPDLFALTAIGDGFLLDTTAKTLTQHFCYVPDGGDGVPTTIWQSTDAIAYDPADDKLYAQPLTYDAAAELQYAQVAQYSRRTGTDEAWFNVPAGTHATGAVYLPELGLVLGQDTQISLYDTWGRALVDLDDLSRFGVMSIDGLAFDPTTGALVVVDQVADQVFDIDLGRISL